MANFRVILGLGCAALLCSSAARAEPISDPFRIDLGTITLTGGGSDFIAIDNLESWRNYTVTFTIVDPAVNSFTALTAEILDPLSDGFDGADPTQPDYVPAGYSTSNNTDGLSFAWNSWLERSATFASGGTAALHVDEDTNAHDMLTFTGFSPGEATVTFGLRDMIGDRGFLLRLSVNGEQAPIANPEPASLLLLGTGLVGLARYRRRLAA